MIDVVLARRLREAGYPQGEILLMGVPIPRDSCPDYPKFPEIPEILKEILILVPDIHLNMGGSKTWWAVGRDHNQNALVAVQTGRNLEQALSNLWIALKKNASQRTH